MSQTIAEQLVKIAENEVKLYEKTFGKGYVQGREKGYKEGYDEGLAVSKPEDLSDVLNEQEEKIATLSAILDKKASGGGNNNLKEYFEGTTTDLYWGDLENLNNTLRQGAMTSINFPAVKIICDNAFYACRNLKSVTIDSVTDIGIYAFYNCSQLVEMRFPASLLEIKSSAFGSCAALSSVTFDGKPTSISSTAFSSCTNLRTINVPWADGAVKNAPWGATNATINYNYTGG